MQGERTEIDVGKDHAVAQGASQAPPPISIRYARLLGRIDLFAGLERVALAKLAAHLEPRSHPAHEVIFRQGEPGDALYLVVSGSVGIYLQDESGAAELRVNVLHAGEPFGEMALLTNKP